MGLTLLLAAAVFLAGAVVGVAAFCVFLLFIQPAQYRGAGPARSDD